VSQIRAITICQPWAWAILHGPTPGTAFKRFEMRDWPSDYVGPLVIHAGKSDKWMRDGCAFLERQGVTLPGSFEFGAVLGMVDMVDCVRPAECGGDPYTIGFGSYCFVLEKPRRLARPLPMKGQLQLWKIDAAIVGELLDGGALPDAPAGETREQRIDRAIAAAGPGRVKRAAQGELFGKGPTYR
jgi:hypothetical protein